MVIWANHNLRSSITAMQGTTATIFKEQSLTSIEQNVRERERENVFACVSSRNNDRCNRTFFHCGLGFDFRLPRLRRFSVYKETMSWCLLKISTYLKTRSCPLKRQQDWSCIQDESFLFRMKKPLTYDLTLKTRHC